MQVCVFESLQLEGSYVGVYCVYICISLSFPIHLLMNTYVVSMPMAIGNNAAVYVDVQISF